MNQRTLVCGCAVCQGDIFDGDTMADHKVFERDGDLDYIELAHRECGIADNAAKGSAYWEYDK